MYKAPAQVTLEKLKLLKASKGRKPKWVVAKLKVPWLKFESVRLKDAFKYSISFDSAGGHRFFLGWRVHYNAFEMSSLI
jgi:hypothetical protein